MAQEIDISKLHGIIKQYALACERDKAGSKGYGKLNTTQELNLFKEMVIRNGKQAELKKQLPNMKGISVPVKDNKTSEKDLNKKIINLMKENNPESEKELKETVSEKLSASKPKNKS